MLYNYLTMPKDLSTAHGLNNLAVMKAYGFSAKDMSEKDAVSALMKM